MQPYETRHCLKYGKNVAPMWCRKCDEYHLVGIRFCLFEEPLKGGV